VGCLSGSATFSLSALEVQMRVPTVAFVAALTGFWAASAAALPADWSAAPAGACSIDAPRSDPWTVDFGAAVLPAQPALLRYPAVDDQAAPARRPVPVEYSDGYKTRATIHKYASFATLPLFIANYVVGQDLYNNQGNESKKSLHVGLVTGSAILFGVNTFTGAWNLYEGRKDPNHRAKRMTHGILMMAADVGFLATAMLAPSEHEYEHGATAPTVGNNSASTHRAVALTSMGIATVGYLIMLIGGH
jgi:hypothetical protein